MVVEVDFGDFRLYVFGEVNEDRSWASCCGDVECGVDCLRYLGDGAYLEVVFGDWGGYADDVCFLKSVSAYQVSCVYAG